jgi:ATP-binding cassette subfamily B protein
VSLLLKQRLFAGILRSDADEIRTRGSGRLLSLISESAVLETIGLQSALTLAIALVELASAVVVLSLGAGASLEPWLLLSWCGLSALLARRYLARRRSWTEERCALAHGFVENVLGYRTRVAQQRPARWHDLEDPMLDHYSLTSARMDAAQHRLAVIPPRGWLLVGILGLVPALLSGVHTQAEVTVALGGILQAYGALGKLAREAVALCGAAVAWHQVSELFRTGYEPPSSARALVPVTRRRRPSTGGAGAGSHSVGAAPVGADSVLDLRGVHFRHDETREPVLEDCSLRMSAGERVVLEGPSGSGKSTLAALISGWRAPRSGCILTRGLDRATLGLDGWRRRVAAAPQFNENYLFSASLAFNLLMSRSWPASAADLEEAAAVCRELGLGPLISRMPSGLDQVVGETGWQLSHGERSRVFLARALLQGADLVILDETFAALDPVTLRRCVDTVLARANTLLVIAHP